MHPIIEALGLKELPAPEVELLQKIFNDNLISIRAQQLMIEHFAPEAIRQLHPMERTALLKRILPSKPALTITWGITRGLHSQKPMIVGTRNTESMFYDGPAA